MLSRVVLGRFVNIMRECFTLFSETLQGLVSVATFFQTCVI